jgi:hypothetical protein
MKSQLGNSLRERRGEEIIVFKYTKKTDVDNNTEPKPKSFYFQIGGILHF